MSIYYIYSYVRQDGTPYYIGKGTGRRAFNETSRTVPPPKDKSRIIIMENNLTEVGALALERFYIRWYGRKDNGTGILRNRTDGGDGVSGYVYTDEHKQKISEANRKRKQTPETRKKIAQSRLGEKHPFFGKKLSEETKRKMSESRRGKKHSAETKLKIKMTNIETKAKKTNELIGCGQPHPFFWAEKNVYGLYKRQIQTIG